MKNENREYCKEIADTLEAITNGVLYKCPECGEYVNAYHAGQECSCGCVMDLENEAWDEVTLCDYFEDALDFEIMTGLNGVYRACRIMVTCGGPNVYVNTRNARVELFWWNESAFYELDDLTICAIDDWMEEYYSCV